MTKWKNVKGASSLHELRQCADGMFDGDSRIHPYQPVSVTCHAAAFGRFNFTYAHNTSQCGRRRASQANCSEPLSHMPANNR